MVKCVLCNYGYIIDKKSISEDKLLKIKKDLTVEPKLSSFQDSFMIKNNNKFEIFQEGKAKIIVPKFYGIQMFGIPETNLIDYKKLDAVNTVFEGKLRDNQLLIINKLRQIYFNDDESLKQFGGGILAVPPGRGKTVMALYLIKLINVKTLVIVHKTFLVNQWVERIKQYLPAIRIGYLYQDVIDIEDKDIVIGMLQSISMKNYDDDIFEDFKFVVFDEVHHLGAKVFSRSLLKIQANLTLGLSATPERKDGLEQVFYWYLGPIIHYDNENNVSDVIVNLYNYSLSKPNDLFKIKILKTTKTINYSRMISNLTKIIERNNFIVKILHDITKHKERRVLVLSNIIDHLRELERLIIEKLPNISYGYYIGGMKLNKLKSSEDKQIILASYAMASEGLDIKALNTLILATPKSDIIQSIGRILRKDKNTIIPTIYDIIDNNNIFKAQAKKRINQYTGRNYEIKYHNIVDEDFINQPNQIDHRELTEDLFLDCNDDVLLHNEI